MKNYIVDRLDNYFKNNYVLNRVPLLVGPSGVAKSALIKEAAERNNMRVVDIRTAFMSRLDIEGLSEKIEVNGNVYSSSSPMFSLIKCTDAYLDLAKKCCDIVREEMAKSDDAHKAVLAKTLEKLEYEAKTPVLLFDEISRGEASVRQVLTKILTDKSFMGYSMKKARVVAATNSQLDHSGEVVDIYMTNDANDVAFYDRFESVYVDSKEMNKTWLKWAKQNFLDETYIEAKFRPYDEDHFGDGSDYSTDIVTPYPCYRTWEMVDKYRRARGENANPAFIANINGMGDRKMAMDTFIREAITSCIPALVISPSGLGKTSRIKALCKKNNYEVIEINLSEVDRIDLEGMPVKRNLLSAMFNGLPINRAVQEKVVEVFKNSGLPNSVTIRAPKKEYVDAFIKAQSTGNKVVIYFDECNRVQNVSVMSAIFQVISDNRLFGVDFDPSNVACILSCNLDENCGDAQDLDPALCARFAIWHRDRYIERDARVYCDYATEQKFHPAVLEYLTSSSNLKSILDSVNTRTLEVSSASTRAWEDLSRTLKCAKDKLLDGLCMFSSEEDYLTVSQFTRYNTEAPRLATILDSIKNRIDKWAVAGFDDDETFFYEGSELKTSEFLAKVKEAVKSTENLTSKPDLLKSIIAADQEVWDYRRKYFGIFLGKFASDFVDFYNKRQVNVSVDLTDMDSIKTYILNNGESASNIFTMLSNKNAPIDVIQGAWSAFSKANDKSVARKVFLANLSIIFPNITGQEYLDTLNALGLNVTNVSESLLNGTKINC